MTRSGRISAALPWAIAIVISIVVVYAGALAYSFSQDDFAWLGRAGGLYARLDGPWRWLSQQAFFDAWRALFGLDPLPYHAASLAVHAACSLLLFAWLRRWVALPWAAVGATFFATHPAVYTAVYWISAMGDSLALAFGLLTLLLVCRRDAWRWTAVPAFALSLASKESTLLLPAFLLLPGASRPGMARRPAATSRGDPVLLVLVGMAIGFGVWLLALGGSGAPIGGASSDPYSVGVGSHLWKNLLTYSGWGVNTLVPFVTSFTDAIDPAQFAWGGAFLVLWLAGCASGGLRRRGWALAGAYALPLLLPVLALRNHTYHYYLVAALPGIAWMLAAILDAAAAGLVRRAWVASTAALIVVAMLSMNGRALVRKIEMAPLGDGPLRADPTVDRALVMDRVAAGISAARVPEGTRLWFWSPARLVAGAPADAPDTYWERNVRAATVEGLAVRVLFPQIQEIGFVRELSPIGPGDRYAIFGVDGRTDVFDWTTLDSILGAEPVEP